MATIQKRKSDKTGKISYTVLVRMKGYPTQTATFDRLADAKEWASLTETNLKQNKYFNYRQSIDLTFSELLERYIKEKLDKDKVYHQKVITHLKWWELYLSEYKTNDITPSLLSNLQEKLKREKNISNSTVNRYTTSLSGLFTIAIKEWELLRENPVSNISKKKEPNGRVRYLTSEEIQKLLNACKQSASPYLYYIVLLALSTGARYSEIITLKWENIDFKRKLIYLLDTKNKEARSIPISNKVYMMLIELKDKYGYSGLLFPGKDKLNPTKIRNSWVRVIERAGVENFRFHDLRHTAASYLAMNGATLIELSHILGHKTLQMVKRYAHLTDQHTAELIERMNQKAL